MDHVTAVLPPGSIDLCVPYNRNLSCLMMAAQGWSVTTSDRRAIRRVLLHVQQPTQKSEAVKAFEQVGLAAEVVSEGQHPEGDMTGVMDTLFSAAKAPWVIMTEQDVFPAAPFDQLIAGLAKSGYIAAGPLDSMYLDNPNARKQPRYNSYSRDGVKPGYFHASLIVLNRDEVVKVASTDKPFRLPPKFRLFGHGVLGGEVYYGLGVRLKDRYKDLLFWRQVHGDYGYSAAIMAGFSIIAVHLYYSSTRDGYVQHGSLTPEERDWLASEETRFLKHYDDFIVKEAGIQLGQSLVKDVG